MSTDHTFDSVQQTLVMPGPAAGAQKAPQSAPRKFVALLQGSQPNFSAETNRILQSRLRQVSLLLFFGFLAFLIKALLFPSRAALKEDSITLWMLFAVTGVMGLTAHRLCTHCHHFLAHLRVVEAVIFGSSALLFMVVGYCNSLYTASQGYLLSVSTPWMILIFTYAMFIPNTWKRALLMIIPIALGPLLTLVLASLTSPQVAALIRNTNDFHHIFLETVMGMTFVTAIAVGGVRLIRGLRTQAFQAQQLGQYRLKQLLGKGGMGEVHLAEHVMLKRPCALKLIRPEKAGDPGTLARFEQEVQATAKLTHWNTVEIYDYGRTDDDTFYYVMEYLPGMSLEQIVEMHGPMPAGRIIHLLTQTCDALAEAHAQGMVHRDIKPANIFAAKRGGTYDVAKLLDFGLVRSLENEADLRLTQDGTVTGSPLYMSPEQARGDEVDARSDIYALGCVAYSLLTGRPPFQESKAVKLILAHAQQQVERPSQLRPEISSDLESVILRCLEKSPEDRFESVEALRDALLDCRDAGSWTRQDAINWWQNHGCPKKRTLDQCIDAGIMIENVEQATERVSVPTMTKA